MTETPDDAVARALDDRISAAMPAVMPPFEGVRRRVRRQQARTAALVAAVLVLVVGVGVGGWAAQRPDGSPRPAPPVGSTSATDPAPDPTPTEAGEVDRTAPTYDRSATASGLVARLPEGDVQLPADTSCWMPGSCHRGLLSVGPGAETEPPDLGARDGIDVWFAQPGWTFSATLRRVGEDCPRVTTVDVEPVAGAGGQWFRIDSADEPGRYQVDLFGFAPEAMVSTRFFWTTTEAGPVDPPAARILVAPDSRGDGWVGLELVLDDLPLQPVRREVSRVATVTVGDRTYDVPLVPSSLPCEPNGRGSFYYQGEWQDDVDELGRPPLDLTVTWSVRGTTYTGRASVEPTFDPETQDSPYVALDVTPALPREQPD